MFVDLRLQICARRATVSAHIVAPMLELACSFAMAFTTSLVVSLTCACVCGNLGHIQATSIERACMVASSRTANTEWAVIGLVVAKQDWGCVRRGRCSQPLGGL